MDRLATGTGRCSGWSYVTTATWSGWVRDRYLAGSPPPTPINLNTVWVPVLPMEFCTLPLDPGHDARFNAAELRAAVERAAGAWNAALREATHRRPLSGPAIRYTGDCEVGGSPAQNERNEISVEPLDPELADRFALTSNWVRTGSWVGSDESDIAISPQLSPGCELRGVLMHEFGHSFGFSHGGETGDLMHAAYAPCASGPSAGEVTALLDLWARTDLGRYRHIPVDGRVLGDPDAPVRIVVLEDFACPYCGLFSRAIKPLIEEEYIDAGIVSLEFRHLAVLAPYSARAAAASECAADQNLFWPYHDLLFRQPTVQFKDVARHMNAALGGPGLDLDEFDACVDNGTHEQSARESTSESTQLLIRLGARRLGVPAFVINGELWRVGLPPLQVFRDEIDRIHGAASGGE